MDSHRNTMEVEAFERARAFDTATIIRQNEVIEAQRREIDRLNCQNRTLTERINEAGLSDECPTPQDE